jgi:2-polyprenyl-3-methyl-5-hydroxy-6-metoxy-1,4-benzoquinol methylase
MESFMKQWARYETRLTSSNYRDENYLKNLLTELEISQYITGKNLIEIGAGDGRIVGMLLNLGAAHVTGVEPTKTGFTNLKDEFKDSKNFKAFKMLEEVPVSIVSNTETFICIGVLHHLEDPAYFLDFINKHMVMSSGSRLILWVYKDKSKSYTLLIKWLRSRIKGRPTHQIQKIAATLEFLSRPYIFLSKLRFPVPLNEYMRRNFANLHSYDRTLLIYDQLSPVKAEYFTEKQVMELLRNASLSVDVMRETLGSGILVIAKGF